MPCLKAPTISLPALPSGFGFGLELPGASFDPKLCCKLLPFPIVTPPLPLTVGVPIPPAVVAAIATARATLLAYIDQLQVDCPME
jgi:hypothetical protein